jgi:hypothetical protein
MRKLRLVHVQRVDTHDYWISVTDVPCPTKCGGTVRWAEAGHVPGYRVCDGCGTAWFAAGDLQDPQLAPATETSPGIIGPATEGEAVVPHRHRTRK